MLDLTDGYIVFCSVVWPEASKGQIPILSYAWVSQATLDSVTVV